MKKNAPMVESSQNNADSATNNQKFIFLIPYFNHPAKIGTLVEILSNYKIDILIIDDGSTSPPPQNLNAIIIKRTHNGGKGAAVKDGFLYALKNGYTHAFQIDADMQHDLSKVSEFLDASVRYPNAIICANPIFANDAPKNRLWGRKIMKFWIWLNTLGANINDAMCGFRIYPLICSEAKNYYFLPKSNAMDFDVEILIRAHFNNLEMKWIDVAVNYDISQVSHFRAIKDNLLFCKLHCKYFLLLPKNIWQKKYNFMQSAESKNAESGKNFKESWYERDECAGNVLLNLTIWLVKIMPRYLLNIIVIFVTLIYYAFSPKERKNLAKFYKIAGDFCDNNGILLQRNAKKSINKPQIYLNFYHFGWAICDKIASWIGKINHNDLEIKDKNFIINELCSGKKGQILVMSHFGNIEVARALSNNFYNLHIVTFVYQKNSEKFLKMIDRISKQKIDRIYVDEIDIKRLLELREILDKGGHIGIMGDRVALNNKRNVKMNFLGKPCYFPLGAFIIAQLLEAKISAMWCEKIEGKYRVEIESLGDTTAYSGRDKTANLKPLVQKYVNSLQTHTLNNPTQWFSFYDFWESPRDLDFNKD